jgi:hypothetical protein
VVSAQPGGCKAGERRVTSDTGSSVPRAPGRPLETVAMRTLWPGGVGVRSAIHHRTREAGWTRRARGPVFSLGLSGACGPEPSRGGRLSPDGLSGPRSL